jgi:DNA-dependent metalloprotease WSS1
MTSRIRELKAIDNLPDKERALSVLKEIAVWVEPIMTKRDWLVGSLEECNFRVPNIAGMNYNAGKQIQIRLRRQNDLSSFFELETLLDTMLHELCHNVHGNHSAAFYELWEELRKELASNLSRGVKGSGAGFDAKGLRVNPETRDPSSLLEARRKAAEAAAKRHKTSQLLGSGPQKLGGSSELVKLGEADAVRLATMRRCSEWCGNDKEEEAKAVVAEVPRPAKMARVDSTTWSCDICTFGNDEADPICTACVQGVKVRVLFWIFCFIF